MDIVCDIATEKIRNDFGDFFSTIFQILIIQKGCTIYEINKLIPNVDYKIIRFTLFLLFSHGLIFIDKIKKKKISIETAKIYASIYAAIYRIRFPRFLCIIEKEFGHVGRDILKIFFEYGQVTPLKIIKKLHKLKTKNVYMLEDCLNNLARDNFIEKFSLSEPYEFNDIFLTKKKQLNKDNFFKPTSYNKQYLWKVSYSKLNLIFKIDLAICTSEENFNSELKVSIQTSFCRISGNNNVHILFNWFSIDTLADYIKDTTDENIIDDLFITRLTENSNLIQFILEVKNCMYHFKIKNILGILQIKTIEKIIINQFGKKFSIIFKMLNSHKTIDEEQIMQECFIEKKTIRKFIYQMYRMSFVFLEERNKYNVSISSKNISLWKLNINMVLKKFLIEIYKTIYNIIIRIEDLKISIKKKDIKSDTNLEDLKKRNLSYINILRLSIIRLDELLILLE